MENKKLCEMDIIFLDDVVIREIQEKLPMLMQNIEHDHRRGGKLGMEIGIAREKILVGLLITKLGEENVNIDIPAHEKEIDVVVFDKPISIKTLTKKKLDGIKMTWTNSIERSLHFVTTYIPRCDMLLLHINWNSVGGLYLITKDTQITEMKKLGRDKYFKMPKIGTNSKGVSLSVLALLNLISNPSTKHIPIEWNRIQQEQKNEYAKYAALWK